MYQRTEFYRNPIISIKNWISVTSSRWTEWIPFFVQQINKIYLFFIFGFCCNTKNLSIPSTVPTSMIWGDIIGLDCVKIMLDHPTRWSLFGPCFIFKRLSLLSVVSTTFLSCADLVSKEFHCTMAGYYRLDRLILLFIVYMLLKSVESLNYVDRTCNNSHCHMTVWNISISLLQRESLDAR